MLKSSNPHKLTFKCLGLLSSKAFAANKQMGKYFSTDSDLKLAVLKRTWSGASEEKRLKTGNATYAADIKIKIQNHEVRVLGELI